ncbi:hypothetical protein IRT45_05570 [Nocardia sp. BSTN01]|uniref:hypothetical protein n=1 Tax=Nocardia sp. BSTN01 TaxID=2783665 RepID=UPI00188E4397|nr:hypothetical protein [Nocardia sp. BSTN01]MBF4996622.1 hypothetical protein [Nocardia sp. BSTN01]
MTLMVTAGGVKLVPPAIGPGTVRTTFPPEVATVPATVPPEAVAETNVEFAGVGNVIFRLLMLFTVKPDAELGTDDEPGVRVMATAEPDAVPVTDVIMLEVWPIPKMVPLQFQFTLTGAAFAGAARQKTVATATGARTPARTREEMDLMTDSRKCRATLRPNTGPQHRVSKI